MATRLNADQSTKRFGARTANQFQQSHWLTYLQPLPPVEHGNSPPTRLRLLRKKQAGYRKLHSLHRPTLDQHAESNQGKLPSLAADSAVNRDLGLDCNRDVIVEFDYHEVAHGRPVRNPAVHDDFEFRGSVHQTACHFPSRHRLTSHLLLPLQKKLSGNQKILRERARSKPAFR